MERPRALAAGEFTLRLLSLESPLVIEIFDLHPMPGAAVRPKQLKAIIRPDDDARFQAAPLFRRPGFHERYDHC